MGLLDRIFGGGGESKQEQETDLLIDDPGDEGWVRGTYRGEDVLLEREYSPNGDWLCLFARSGTTGEAPVVLMDAAHQFQHGFSVGRAENVAVANSGHVVVTDIGPAKNQELGGVLYVVDRTGELVIEHEFDANIWECAISDDGRYASTATYNPDRTVYIFDTDAGELVTEFESDLNGPPQEFDRLDNDVALYLLSGENRYRAINLEGETVWRSSELQEQDRIEELLDRGDQEDLREALKIFEEAYELADGGDRGKEAVKNLADTHWKLANKIRREQGDTDEWWANLSQSKTYYMEILQWRDGRKGVAKVQRKQAKYHLKEGNDETALELLENLADLEDELDTQLLTDADKEKIENLS